MMRWLCAAMILLLPGCYLDQKELIWAEANCKLQDRLGIYEIRVGVVSAIVTCKDGSEHVIPYPKGN